MASTIVEAYAVPEFAIGNFQATQETEIVQKPRLKYLMLHHVSPSCILT